MDRQQLFGCFQFNDQSILDEEVQSSFAYRVPLVRYPDGFLPFEAYASQSEFDRHRFLVNSLKKTGAEDAVNFQRRTNYGACSPIKLNRGINMSLSLLSRSNALLGETVDLRLLSGG